MSRAEQEERKAIALAIYPKILEDHLAQVSSSVLDPALKAFNYADGFLSASRLAPVRYCVAAYTQEGEDCTCPDCVSERLEG